MDGIIKLRFWHGRKQHVQSPIVFDPQFSSLVPAPCKHLHGRDGGRDVGGGLFLFVGQQRDLVQGNRRTRDLYANPTASLLCIYRCRQSWSFYGHLLYPCPILLNRQFACCFPALRQIRI